MASFSATLSPVEKAFNTVAGVLLVGMMLLVVADVGGRYVLQRPVQGTLEITEFAMAAMVFFTIARTQAIKAHIRVELLVGVISRRSSLLLELICYACGFGVFALMTWQGWMSFLDSWGIREQTDGFIPFPIYPAKLTVPIGCFLLCLRFLADIVGGLRELRGKAVP
jgi:TRAP-type C4-dicarboxylate transport system permease small subunit